MKTFYFFLIAFFFIGVTNADGQTFKVNNVDEFLDAIGPNRTIKLKKNKPIFLSDASPEKSSEYYYFRELEDGYELVITGVKNLKITGSGKKPVKMLTEPQYGYVLSFEDCENITLKNIDAGHSPETGFCTGGVFSFKNSKNITIEKTIMFGSGTEGITAEDVAGMRVNKSIIKGCTYHIMTISNSADIHFNNCKFYDNEEFDLVNIHNSIGVNFNSSVFKDNRASSSSALFNVTGKNVVLSNCTVENNNSMFFATGANNIIMQNTELVDNNFEKMYEDVRK